MLENIKKNLGKAAPVTPPVEEPAPEDGHQRRGSGAGYVVEEDFVAPDFRLVLASFRWCWWLLKLLPGLSSLGFKTACRRCCFFFKVSVFKAQGLFKA